MKTGLTPKHWRFLLTLFIVLLVVDVLVYYITGQKDLNADPNLQDRNIETAGKLWLNGYLGTLFHFRFLGNINWLILPLAWIYRKQILASRVLLCLSAFMVLSLILIGLKGYFNPRYQFTLLPLIVMIIVAGIWQLPTIRPDWISLRQPILILLLLACMGNMFLILGGERAIRNFNRVLGDKSKGPVQVTESLPECVAYVKELHLCLDSLLAPGEKVLVNNLPEVYYYTKAFGHYYWCGSDLLYGREGPALLFKNRSPEQARSYIVDTLGCSWVYTFKSYNRYNPAFETFLKEDCEQRYSDYDFTELYRIRR
jgi:hypothetical protein